MDMKKGVSEGPTVIFEVRAGNGDCLDGLVDAVWADGDHPGHPDPKSVWRI